MEHETSLESLPTHISDSLDAAMFSSQPLQEVLDLVMDTALELVHAQYGSLRWVNRRKRTLELKSIRIASDTRPGSIANIQDLKLDDSSVMAKVVKTKEPQLIPDLSPSWRLYSGH